MNPESLRKKYPRFIYKKYFYTIVGKDLKIWFGFEIPPSFFFHPKIIIKNVKRERVQKLKKEILDNLVFHLGLIEMISYWKLTCSPEIEIKKGRLDRNQIRWWQNLIINGMGEFFYKNKINFKRANFLKINSRSQTKRLKVYKKPLNKNKILVPVGGGKDSIVGLEILKKSKKEINCFSLNPTGASKKIIKIANFKKPIIVKRSIDKNLLELNRKGFLDGHTPFSGYLAFLSALLALIFDFKYVAFCNERSANEGNLKYLGKIINHQWSKSFDFEKKFRNYSKKYLIEDLEYFSFLRPLYEIQIAKCFSRYSQYFSAFLSCNEAYKTYSGTKKPTEKWCCNCPKCLFVFSILYPFLEKFVLIKIFGQDLFKKRNLLPIMKQLIGQKDFKPFECVGTKKETLVAFYLSWKKLKLKKEPKRVDLPFLLKYFEKRILPKYPSLDKESKKIINSWNKNHCLPKEFEKLLKQKSRLYI
ncbi:hypothetical protein J7J39_01625 [bacterium]|nr:hypothetical protein [bacterium]